MPVKSDRTTRGFSLVEILVALAIIAAVAAILIPGVANRVRQSESSSIAATLDALRAGILEYRADVRRYPTNLQYLSEQPANAEDICGRDVPAGFLANWKGPYVNRPITAAGLKVADATIVDAISLSPLTFTATTSGELTIQVQEVDSAVARSIERGVDTTLDFATGTIRWTDVSGGRGTLSFIIPARGC